MAHVGRARHRYTYEEYLAYDRDSALEHEFDDGEILAMAGVSRRHNALALRVGAALDRARKPGCHAFQSDQKVRVLAIGRATYPDATVVCGDLEGDPADPSGQTITNPTLLVEVLSPSTEHDDRGSKWLHYQCIPSLQEHVLVSQGERRVERYRRLPTGGLGVHGPHAGHRGAHDGRGARSRQSLRRAPGLRCSLRPREPSAATMRREG